MAAIAEITFANTRLADLCRGLDPYAYEDAPPQTVAEGEEFVRSRIIQQLKIAYKRGQKATYEDGFVELPFDDILS